jgi:hypothetical protein
MDELANWIAATNPDRAPVINKTGLQGAYKFKIAFSAGAVQHFIVDSIEKPDEN